MLPRWLPEESQEQGYAYLRNFCRFDDLESQFISAQRGKAELHTAETFHQNRDCIP